MTSEDETYQPVRIHLASVEPGLSLGSHAHAARPGRRLVVRPKTFVLTAAEPCRLIAPADEDRIELWLIGEVTSGSIVGHSRGDIAQYADTAYASPPEDTLYIPAGDAKMPNVPIPFHTTEALWAASPQAASTVTVKIRVIMISESAAG